MSFVEWRAITELQHAGKWLEAAEAWRKHGFEWDAAACERIAVAEQQVVDPFS
jgi:hypothetical protein